MLDNYVFFHYNDTRILTKGGVTVVLFKTAKQVSEEYGISLATVYYRIRQHHYRVNDYNEILVADVERHLVTGFKAGRPKGVKDTKKRKRKGEK